MAGTVREPAGDDAEMQRLSGVPDEAQQRFVDERRLRDAAFEADDKRLTELWVRIRMEDPNAIVATVWGVPAPLDVVEMLQVYPTPTGGKRGRRAPRP